MQEIEKLQNKINYTFNEEKTLKAALTHSSFANEHKGSIIAYNQRLEFLGDSILGLMVSEYLFTHYRHLPEGVLTRIRSGVVCEQGLYVCAKAINLGDALFLGKGEEQNNGRERISILADAFEALIAAIYLDGGFDAAKDAIMPMLHGSILEAAEGKLNRDYKTMLQEIVQKNKEETLEYQMVLEEGPDHNKLFTVELLLNSNSFSKGQGKSKKEAEQAAAREALALMGEL